MNGAHLTLAIRAAAPSLEGELLRRVSDTRATPALLLRALLELYRDRGMEFEEAWASAIRSLPRPSGQAAGEMAEWKAALAAAKPVYRSTYTGEALEPDLPIELEGLQLVVGRAA